MLTPIDIDNKAFSRQFKGYSVEEVDEFLDEISDELEELLKKNRDLEQKVDDMEKSVSQYRAIENTLQDTLVIAQKTAEDVKTVAKKEAEQIIESAQELAKSAVEEMNLSIIKKQQKLDGIKQEINVYRAKMESLLISQLEILSELDEKEFIMGGEEEHQKKIVNSAKDKVESDLAELKSKIEKATDEKNLLSEVILNDDFEEADTDLFIPKI